MASSDSRNEQQSSFYAMTLNIEILGQPEYSKSDILANIFTKISSNWRLKLVVEKFPKSKTGKYLTSR